LLAATLLVAAEIGGGGGGGGGGGLLNGATVPQRHSVLSSLGQELQEYLSVATGRSWSYGVFVCNTYFTV
jgi:hypothetical protein